MLQPLLCWQGDTLSISDENGESWTKTFISNGVWQDFNNHYSHSQEFMEQLQERSF